MHNFWSTKVWIFVNKKVQQKCALQWTLWKIEEEGRQAITLFCRSTILQKTLTYKFVHQKKVLKSILYFFSFLGRRFLQKVSPANFCCGGALYMALKAVLLGIFSAIKVDKWTRKLKFSIKNNLLILAVFRDHFRSFWGSKKSFSRLFQSCFGIV